MARAPKSWGWGYAEMNSTLKSFSSIANYDYLTIDLDFTEEQLLLCSY